MRPLRLLTALLLACAGLVLVGSPASACTCVKQGLAKQAEDAAVVFTGVLQRQQREKQLITFTFDVQRVYQGHLDGNPAAVTSGVQRSACGLGRLEVDRAYVVFADRERGGSSCSGTGRATPAYVADVERVLGEGNPAPSDPQKEPAPDPEFTRVGDVDPPEFTRIAAPGGAMVLLGLLGLVLFRRRA